MSPRGLISYVIVVAGYFSTSGLQSAFIVCTSRCGGSSSTVSPVAKSSGFMSGGGLNEYCCRIESSEIASQIFSGVDRIQTSKTFSMPTPSRLRFSSLSEAAQGSAYLLTHRSWTSRIGTGFRKWSFSRPRRFVVTRFASSSTRRCFMTPKRVIGNRCSSALRLCPSTLNSSSSSCRLVGSARALNTASMPKTLCDYLVTCQPSIIERLLP
jgi:hypothetical protein